MAILTTVRKSRLIRSTTKGRYTNLVNIYYIHRGKREANDGAQVYSKATRITKQWRIVDVIFSRTI